jgi:cold shock CspA family protein
LQEIRQSNRIERDMLPAVLIARPLSARSNFSGDRMLNQRRLDGTVAVFFPDRGWGFLSLDHDANLFFHERDIRPDWKGSTAWGKVPGTPITYLKRVSASKKHAGATSVAADDVAPVFEDAPAEDLATYREVSKVRTWNSCFGALIRECGSELFFHKSSIIQGRASDIQTGHFLFHGISQREDGRWCATDTQLYSFEEQQRLQQGLSAYEVEPVAEPVSELLTAANRNKTLIELIREKRECQNVKTH